MCGPYARKRAHDTGTYCFAITRTACLPARLPCTGLVLASDRCRRDTYSGLVRTALGPIPEKLLQVSPRQWRGPWEPNPKCDGGRGGRAGLAEPHQPCAGALGRQVSADRGSGGGPKPLSVLEGRAGLKGYCGRRVPTSLLNCTCSAHAHGPPFALPPQSTLLLGCMGFEVVYIDIIGDLLLGTCVERMHGARF